MKAFSPCSIFACLMLWLAGKAAATPTPSIPVCPSKSNVFGIRNPVTSLRGGELLTPSDSEVDSILNSAALNGNKLVVIDFTATWCGPCRAIAPLYEELSEEFSGAVFLKIDVDESPITAQKYSVSAMPTFLFVKAGEVVDRLMGANPARLRELIEEHM